MKAFSDFLDWLSGQWILDRWKTNGGDVVILRTAFITALFAIAAIIAQALIDPARTGPISLQGFRSQLVDLGGWIAAFFGAAYLALYSRFVSQWSYLANVYNMIKQAESAKDANKDVIASWKAGFIEDAEHLHLVAKVSLAPIIKNWTDDPSVRAAFIQATPAGERRLANIYTVAKLVCEHIEKRS